MKEQKHGNVIGFDFGLKKVGVAFGETLLKTSRPYKTIIAKNGIPDWREVDKIFTSLQPKFLVIGLPLSLEGKEQEISKKARKFGNRLNGRYRIKIFFQPEQLTSFEARLRDNVNDSNEDAHAAQIILDEFLHNN